MTIILHIYVHNDHFLYRELRKFGKNMRGIFSTFTIVVLRMRKNQYKHYPCTKYCVIYTLIYTKVYIIGYKRIVYTLCTMVHAVY